jgi:hypothetical protein
MDKTFYLPNLDYRIYSDNPTDQKYESIDRNDKQLQNDTFTGLINSFQTEAEEWISSVIAY